MVYVEYSPYLMHRGHKYIKKEKINGKWRYYYNPNKWEVNSLNYAEKKKELENDPEWQEIVKNKDPEYCSYNSETGTWNYKWDDYLTNKKHPILDALKDYGYGRKVSVLKQDSETFIAGAKDYVEMARRSFENIMSLGVGILTAKIKNQQGSYDAKKQEISTNINTAQNMVNDVLTTYNNVNTASNREKAKQAVDSAKAIATSEGQKAYNQAVATAKSEGTKAYNNAVATAGTSEFQQDMINLGVKYLTRLFQ